MLRKEPLASASPICGGGQGLAGDWRGGYSIFPVGRLPHVGTVRPVWGRRTTIESHKSETDEGGPVTGIRSSRGTARLVTLSHF